MTTKILLSQVSAPNTATTGSVVSLQSDGTFGSGTTIANGTSNVSITSANGNINLSVAGNTKVSIDSSTLALASLQGIKFQATQSASSDANTLDDYEEGTWTPTATSAGGSITTSTSGTYVKVGRSVTVTLRITVSSVGSGTGALLIGNFPFTGSISGATREDAVSGYAIVASPDGGSGGLFCTKIDNTSPLSMGSGMSFTFNIAYITS